MSIENNLASIAKSLEAIAQHLQNGSFRSADTVPYVEPVATVEAPAPAPVPAPVVEAPAPFVPTPAPAAAGPTAVAPSVPAPFTDTKGLMEYCMTKYKEFGPSRGGQIQQILIAMGHNNINSLRPDQYGEFYTKVEGIV